MSFISNTREFLNQQQLLQVPQSEKESEQFSLSSDRTQTFVHITSSKVVSCYAPSCFAYLRHRLLQNSAWQILFCKADIKSDTGLHAWQINTDAPVNNLRIGCIFGEVSESLQSDYGKGRFDGSKFFSNSSKRLFGLDYASGIVFGGLEGRLSPTYKGPIVMKLDTNADEGTIIRYGKTHTFAIPKLQQLRTEGKKWEALFWVATYPESPPAKHQISIARYAHEPDPSFENRMLQLAAKLQASVAPTHPHLPEQFVFTTDSKNKYLAIQKGNPQTIKYLDFQGGPLHIAFAKNIVQKNSGIHTWHIITNTTATNLKVGIYFADDPRGAQSDFGASKNWVSIGHVTTYLLSNCNHIVGLDCRTGSTIGTSSRKQLQIKKGAIAVSLDTSSDTLSFQEIGDSSQVHRLQIEEIAEKRKKSLTWKAVFWAALGGGKSCTATITSYHRQLKSKI